ncbi:MAG: hypothetical protein HQ515_14215 [Phycisphaeraceae bacterium]|nr:hypothetical protein [Phycisphaeraceae bacterium]
MVCLPEMVTRGKVCPSVIELIDLFPTVTELAGLKLPKGLEGKSFVPLIQNPMHRWDRVAHTQSGEGRNRSVCNGRFRYTQWADGAVELYDHNTDPGEWYNQSDNPVYSSVIAELKAKLLPLP